jgi:hypothetical protein
MKFMYIMGLLVFQLKLARAVSFFHQYTREYFHMRGKADTDSYYKIRPPSDFLHAMLICNQKPQSV